jgi:hypothetical protein
MKQSAIESANSVIEAQKQIDQYNLNQQEKQLDSYKKAQQDKIDSIDAEIDALQKKWALEEEIAERNKYISEITRLNQVASILQNGTLTSISDELAKQLKIEDLKKQALEHQNALLEKQKELQSVQQEKNVRLFENGQFSWVADPRKIQDLQEEISDMEKDYTEQRKDELDSVLDELKSQEESYLEWQKQKNRDAIVDQLEQRKKAIEEDIKQREEKFALEQEAFNTHYEHMDILAASYLDELKKTYGSKWDEILQVLSTKLSSAESMYNKLRGYSGASLSGNTPSGSTNTNSQPKYEWSNGKWNLVQYHTGLNEGIVGENQSISSWLSQKFGLKSNEKLVKLLNGEAVIKNPINMVDNFLSSMRIQQPNFAGLISPSAPSVDKSETFHIENVYVKANDATQFLKNLRLQVKNK